MATIKSVNIISHVGNGQSCGNVETVVAPNSIENIPAPAGTSQEKKAGPGCGRKEKIEKKSPSGQAPGASSGPVHAKQARSTSSGGVAVPRNSGKTPRLNKSETIAASSRVENEERRSHQTQNTANKRDKRIAAKRKRDKSDQDNYVHATVGPKVVELAAPATIDVPPPAPPPKRLSSYVADDQFNAVFYTDSFSQWYRDNIDTIALHAPVHTMNFDFNTTSKVGLKYIDLLRNPIPETYYDRFNSVLGPFRYGDPIATDFNINYMGPDVLLASQFEVKISPAPEGVDHGSVQCLDPMNTDTENDNPRHLCIVEITRTDHTISGTRTTVKTFAMNYSLYLGAIKYGVSNVGLTDSQYNARVNNFLRMSSTYLKEHDVSFSEEQMVEVVAHIHYRHVTRKTANLGLFWRAPTTDTCTDIGSGKYLCRKSETRSLDYVANSIKRQHSRDRQCVVILAVLLSVLLSLSLILLTQLIFSSDYNTEWGDNHPQYHGKYRDDCVDSWDGGAEEISGNSPPPIYPPLKTGSQVEITLKHGRRSCERYIGHLWKEFLSRSYQRGEPEYEHSSRTNGTTENTRSQEEFTHVMTYLKSCLDQYAALWKTLYTSTHHLLSMFLCQTDQNICRIYCTQDGIFYLVIRSILDVMETETLLASVLLFEIIVLVLVLFVFMGAIILPSRATLLQTCFVRLSLLFMTTFVLICLMGIAKLFISLNVSSQGTTT